MGKSLVIVESPAKARTINKYLGNSYVVKSSIGHIRDLPKGGRRRRASSDGSKAKKLSPQERTARARDAMIRRMGIDPENGWKAQYEILPEKLKVLKELRAMSEKVGDIYLATDLDREGEAIAWHLQEAIGGDKGRYKRVIFSEITKKAIQGAFSQPGTIDLQRVRAQQARRFLDRVVGFMLSPLLWKKIARGLSAGRVQSVAVRLIVEREKEIHAFVPEEYWDIWADLKDKGRFAAKVVKHNGKTFRPANADEAERARQELLKASYTVAKREDKPVVKRPAPPFITSTLQQTSSIRLGFSVRKTMTLAQRLYEAGYITYMRTDSTNLSNDALQSSRRYIQDTFGQPYLPDKPQFYKSKATAQEAHEAIRPSDVHLTPEAVPHLEKDQMRLYDLIWRRFLACQMNPARYDATSVTIDAQEYELRANGRVMRFDGWMRILPPAPKKEEGESPLPELKVGESLDLEKLRVSQHFTKPPPRFREASLVRELEKRGIGRPSTYAAIISTIQERGYVRLENRKFHAEKMGDIVTERLVEHFDEIMDYNFTAGLEKELDAIAQGERDWQEALDQFYAKFKKDLDAAGQDMRGNKTIPTDIVCPVCGRPMAIRTARTGVFLSCTGYDLPPKERCKSTLNLVRGEEAVSVNGDDEEEAKALHAQRRCSLCGTAMDSYLIDTHRRLHICGNSPDCPGYEVETGEFRIKGYDGPVIQCDRCGADMELKTGRYGKFFGCTNYPDCTNTRKLLKNGQPAPPKAPPVPMPELLCEKSEGHFVLREGASGLFLASSRFPKSRETRSPLVEDLRRHREELDAKFHFLADAPVTDPDGNKAIVRFKRKEKRHYLTSEKDGKPTSWKSFYEDGKWLADGKD
jgi:DNA topoisomerase-1